MYDGPTRAGWPIFCESKNDIFLTVQPSIPLLRLSFQVENGDRWLTVVSPHEPDGTELLLDPNAEYPEMKALKEALVRDGIPYTAFEVADIQETYTKLKQRGVEFTMEPTNMGPTTVAVFDDTCGNLLQIYQVDAN